MKTEKELLEAIIKNNKNKDAASDLDKMVLHAISIVRDAYIKTSDEIDMGFLFELQGLQEAIKSK
ncbi:MAG: hypothetical protein IJE43_21645 [Alphaproteobacteria bacterium]|nr:hypothetical protein [Alphaproteobacteria bacterium]